MAKASHLKEEVSYKALSPISHRKTYFYFSGDVERQVIEETLLQWSSIGDGRSDVVIHGESDFAILKNLRNVLLSLQTEFTEGGSKVVFTGEKKDDLNKRLILLEGEIDGLLKRKINYSVRDNVGGTRVLDYTGILNEK